MEVWILPLVYCHEAGARLGVNSVNLCVPHFLHPWNRDALPPLYRPLKTYRRAVVYKQLSFTDTIICSISK